MVGDIKQSIYRFRGAEPDVFSSYRAMFPKNDSPEGEASDGVTVFMSNNFRCDASVIDFTNLICSYLFTVSNSQIHYCSEDDLICSKTVPDGYTPQRVKMTVILPPEEDEESVRGSGAKNQKRIEGKFPNLAGFCRFLKIGTEDLLGFSEEFPEAVAYILAVFEDEALNSSVSPTLLTAYLKRRLGYERELDRKERPIPADALPVIRFEHDVYGDGE
jgi:hypothetical protein